MTGEHAELVAELRALAETVLERIEPILQKASARGADEAEDQAGCTACSWCPLCALAALIRGEQHDLVTAVAGHGSALLSVLREVLDGHHASAATGTATGEAAASGPSGPSGPSMPATAFVPIDITIRD
ncbi:hypothetical protein C8K36_1011222 [Rhodococcus sp. OK519]|uniref:hypothetical protein n=1 Tax=Rhodococcus sp. OK519 TaxID=2135729 RepID=UPI000D3C81FE|nr:hypothetical protein C8K36_1011222 [Rhodococcus sp. OK519]